MQLQARAPLLLITQVDSVYSATGCLFLPVDPLPKLSDVPAACKPFESQCLRKARKNKYNLGNSAEAGILIAEFFGHCSGGLRSSLRDSRLVADSRRGDSIVKRLLCSALIVASMAMVPAFTQAGTIILGNEDPAAGFVGTIPGTLIQVGSDGESAFTPFNTGSATVTDTSDAIDFDAQVAAGNPWSQTGNAWIQVAGHPNQYYASAAGENEPPGEPVGVFQSPNPFVSSVLGTYVITDTDTPGGISDIITLSNGPNGAVLTFASDPLAVPEPSTMMLFGIGGLAMAGYARRRRKSCGVAAAS